jgi:hypothetical protein
MSRRNYEIKLHRLLLSEEGAIHKNGARSQFHYELAWVRTYLKKAGLAENSAWSMVPY